MNEYRIMIVDDEPDILSLLEKALNITGFYNIIKTDNGITAVNICEQNQPDIIILDIMLPGIDGYEVCKRIRQFFHCPILFLSSKNDELDKLLGLAVGGDDYVTKPFSPKEVAYRVKAQLRRAEYKNTPMKNQSTKIGQLMIDTQGCRVTKGEKEIELTAREFEILNCQKIREIVKHQKEKKKCQRLLDTNQDIKKFAFWQFWRYDISVILSDFQFEKPMLACQAVI